MDALWMGLLPDSLMTRILVLDPSHQTLLKAWMPHGPGHPRCIPILCEALALWCNRPIRAALAVDGPDVFCATPRWLETFESLSHTPLYEIAFVRQPSLHHRDGCRQDTLADFAAVRQLFDAKPFQ